jgi:hypothetical protein
MLSLDAPAHVSSGENPPRLLPLTRQEDPAGKNWAKVFAQRPTAGSRKDLSPGPYQ